MRGDGLRKVAQGLTTRSVVIRATDEHTVTFTMCAADPAFEAKAAFIVFGIQPSEHIAANGPS